MPPAENQTSTKHRRALRSSLRASCRVCADGVVVGMAKKNIGIAKKKNGRAGERGGYWEYCAALLPIRFNFVPFGTGDLGSDIKLEPGRPVLMRYVDDAVEQKCFYEALLELPWLAPSIRRLILKELGRSQRAENVEYERARTLVMRAMINERKAVMKKKGERPRGGIHEAALAEIANEQGLSVAALKWRLRNLKK
jgi:hypothetical protein